MKIKAALTSRSFLWKTAYLQVGLTNRATARQTSTSSDDYQYIKKSMVPTMHFQPSLPRLPIPLLDRTCQRYLAAQRPLLTDEQFKITDDIVKEFLAKEGKALHQELVLLDRRSEHTSYVADAWLDMYLTSRVPVTNVNAGMVLANDPKFMYNDQLIRASNLTISALRFLRSLRANLLEPEVQHTIPAKSDTTTFRRVMRLTPSRIACQCASLIFKAIPLDMSQYLWQFCNSRVPLRHRDELVLDEKATHVMVLRNGNVYVFDVLDEKGCIKEPSFIHGCFHRVLADSRPKAEIPVAVMTSLDRDSAADMRQQLVDAGNAEVVQLLDSAIFSISLNDVAVGDDTLLLIKTVQSGDGTNRWSDKGLELQIMKDGKAAMCPEHSRIDGLTNLRFINDVFRDSVTRPFIHPNSTPANVDSSAVKCLEFRFGPQTKQEIQNAIERHREAALRQKFVVFRYDKFGKNFIKKQKLSPDAILQLAFQIGFHRLSGKTVATYEACSTAAFRHGRTETIRSATEATKRCSKAFASRDKSAAELRMLIASCSRAHQVLAREAASGNGFDRHLFMLRLLADASGSQQLPAIFTDPAYHAINHNILSTSGLQSDALNVLWFSPVVLNGLGIYYGVKNYNFQGVISSHTGHSDAVSFLECLLSSLDDIQEVLLKTSF